MKKLLLITGVLLMATLSVMAKESNLRIDMIGYRPADSKYIISLKKEEYFHVYKEGKKKYVYANDFGEAIEDRESGDTCYVGNFSEVTEPGNYYIETESGDRTYNFTIDEDIYRDVFYKAMHAFYLQRCGIEVDSPTGFKHAKCHTAKAELHPTADEEEYEIDVSGGWHDAGDYGKYVVNSGISTGSVLLMYERNIKKLENFKTGIPEYQKVKDMPDILDEAKWNIDWMLKMQREDGGVYHKATLLRFSDVRMMPENDFGQRYVFEVSTAATADFAAVMAIASRLYGPYGADFADKCLAAAEKAWAFLDTHKDIMPAGGFKNPDDAKTGQYGDGDDKDERLWAAVELFTATGKDVYHNYFKDNYSHWSQLIQYAPSWQDVRPLAMTSYCYSFQPNKDAAVVGQIKMSLNQHAEEMMARINENGYRSVMRDGDFHWGSNATALNFALNLICAAEITGVEKYKQGALEIVHYILGRNPFGMSYVTGVGEKYPMEIHHRPTLGDGVEEPWPGMLAGGPNSKLQDRIAKSMIEFGTPPARCYVDHWDSYSTNEIAINWNAPLVYVLSAFIK